MTAPTDEARPVPSAVLSLKIDNLAAEILELRRDLRGLVRTDLYEEGRRADQRRIETNEAGLRALTAQMAERRERDERDRASRRWQLGLAMFAAGISIVVALYSHF